MEIKNVSKVTDKIVSYSNRQGFSPFKNSLSKYFLSFKRSPKVSKTHLPLEKWTIITDNN